MRRFRDKVVRLQLTLFKTARTALNSVYRVRQNSRIAAQAFEQFAAICCKIQQQDAQDVFKLYQLCLQAKAKNTARKALNGVKNDNRLDAK